MINESKDAKPLVSVIITTYARPDNLIRAINSVRNQTYKNIEIIVVDDNGVNTPFQIETKSLLHDLIDSSVISYYAHEINKNGSAARNTGFRSSKGAFINFLDDDDEFSPEKIEVQLNRLQKDLSFDACYCNSILYNTHRTIYTKHTAEGNLTFELLSGQLDFNTSTVLFRRQALIDINGWDERFKRHQDWEVFVRFFRNHRICVANPEIQYIKKYTSANTITRNPLSAIEYREFFLNEMHEDIDKMNHSNLIYRFQYMRLSLSLLKNGCKKEGLHYFKKSLSYGFPSSFELIKALIHLLRRSYYG